MGSWVSSECLSWHAWCYFLAFEEAQHIFQVSDCTIDDIVRSLMSVWELSACFLKTDLMLIADI